MNKILLALGLLISSVASAAATCTGPAVMHDFPGTSFNMSLSTNAGDGNCASNMGIIGTLPPYASTPTFNLGTLNGAATAAKQPALGTAGTPSADVITVQGATSMTPLKTDGSSTTQPVSGMVTANAGTNLNTSALATSANQTNGTQQSKVTDGTNTAAVKAASTAPVATDPALVASISPNGNTVTPAATENHVGEVGGNMIPITNAMTTSNATVTTGQSIGGLQTLAGAVRVSGSLGASGTSGILQSVMLSFTDAVTVPNFADVYFFNASPSGSTCTNAAAFVLAAADRTKVIGIAHVSDFTAGNAAVIGQALNLAMPYGLASATSLFACVVARGSFAITGTANAALMANILRN